MSKATDLHLFKMQLKNPRSEAVSNKLSDLVHLWISNEVTRIPIRTIMLNHFQRLYSFLQLLGPSSHHSKYYQHLHGQAYPHIFPHLSISAWICLVRSRNLGKNFKIWGEFIYRDLRWMSSLSITKRVLFFTTLISSSKTGRIFNLPKRGENGGYIIVALRCKGQDQLFWPDMTIFND